MKNNFSSFCWKKSIWKKVMIKKFTEYPIHDRRHVCIFSFLLLFHHRRVLRSPSHTNRMFCSYQQCQKAIYKSTAFFAVRSPFIAFHRMRMHSPPFRAVSSLSCFLVDAIYEGCIQQTNTQQSSHTHSHRQTEYCIPGSFVFVHLCQPVSWSRSWVHLFVRGAKYQHLSFCLTWAHESWRVSERGDSENHYVCVCYIQTVYVYQIRHSKYVFMCDLIVHNAQREWGRPETVKFN